MAIVSIVIEGVKVLGLTWSNTAFWQASQLKNWYIENFIKGDFYRKNRGKLKNGKVLKAVLSYEKHKRKGRTLFVVYLFAAFLSIGASYGYISQSVYLSTRGNITISTKDTQSIYLEQISSKQDMIDQDKKLNQEYSMAQDKLDMTDPSYQAKYNNYQKKIDANNVDIQKKLAEKEDKINQLQQLKLNEASSDKALGKTMYQLMGESLGLTDSTVMFILLYLLAIMIEVGLFISSPHFNKMDKEDEQVIPELPEPKDIIPDTSIKVSQEDYKRMQEALNSPPPPNEKLIEIMKPQEKPKDIKEPIQESVQVQDSLVSTLIKEEIKVPESIEEKKEVPPTIVESKPEEKVVRKIIDKGKMLDSFIEALFDSTNRMRDKEEVAKEVGLPLVHAIRISEYLTKERGLVMFRPPAGWYRVATLDTIKKAIGKLYGITKE